jgi:hypothetical protein
MYIQTIRSIFRVNFTANNVQNFCFHTYIYQYFPHINFQTVFYAFNYIILGTYLQSHVECLDIKVIFFSQINTAK